MVNKKLFVSVPIGNYTYEGVIYEMNRALDEVQSLLDDENIELIDSYIKEDLNNPLLYMAKSLELMAQADYIFFADGWRLSKGCNIEFKCAVEYNLNIIGNSHVWRFIEGLKR